MTTKYKFKRDVEQSEWGPLPRSFKKGEEIYRSPKHDYGCARDDMMYGGFETISCGLTEDYPFFTVLVSLIENLDGTEVRGDYRKI